MAESDQKEGAWQFLEAFLADTSMEYSFLPVRRDLLQEKAKELMTPDYVLDINGERVVDKDGHPVVRPKLTFWGIGNEEVSVDYMTHEQVEKVYEIIANTDFVPMGETRKDILDIIVEEMTPCLLGKKSFEEGADIVQNRIQNLVWENMQK